MRVIAYLSENLHYMPGDPIALHTDELAGTSIEIMPIAAVKESIQIPHRDDHYIFILQQQGAFRLELDFSEVVLRGCGLLFIAPGQVHRYISKRTVKGWFFFVQPNLIQGVYRDIFDTYQHLRQRTHLKKTDILFGIAAIAQDLIRDERPPFKMALIHSVAGTLVGLIASRITQADGPSQRHASRRYHTVTEFRQLVKTKFKDFKQVRQYAAKLHITPLHLNETVKQITGFTASYWIHQEILLEAKRLLQYTDLDIRQVADELGYEDFAYFSRFFKNHTGMTASAFRDTNHGLSNQRH